MAYSIWDKQPELVLPKIPFELFAGLAERGEKRMDAIDEQVGKTKGLFASLTGAPGHEDMATAKSRDYNNELNTLYDKYKGNLNSREFSREVTSLASRYANDSTVQKVTKSYDWYSKVGAPAIFEARNTNSVIDAQGIIDKDNNFQQNTIEYNPSTFKMTASADYLKPIQEQFNIQKENRKNVHEEKMPVLYGLDGQKIQYSKDEEEQWRNAATLKNVVDSTYDMIKNNANAVPGFRYLVADADRQFGKDEAAKEKYIKETIINASEPFKFHWKNSKEKYDLIGSVGDKDDSDKTKTDASTLGQAVTVSLDPYTDDAGNPLTTFEAVNNYSAKTKEQVVKSKGDIIKTLFTDANGKSTLPADKTGFITTDNGEEIDIASLPDAKLQSQARALNAKFVAEQIKATETKNFIAHFAEKYNLDPDNIEASLTGSPQKLKDVYTKVTDDMAVGLINGTKVDFTNKNFWTGLGVSPTIANNITGAITKNEYEVIKTSGGTPVTTTTFDSKKTYETRLQNLQKIADSLPNGDAKVVLNDHIKLAKTDREVLMQSASPLYKNFVTDVNTYLTSNTYENQWEYAISKNEDKQALRSLLDAAMSEGQFDRAKTDDKTPSLKNAPKIFNDLKVDKEFLDNSSYSIRYDTDRGNFVIDVRGKSSNGLTEVIEVFPKNVAGLTELVNKLDRIMTNKYLTEQKDFFAQMATSNSRYADLNVFDAANNVTGKIRVKRVIEGVNSGTRVEPEELIFKLPELNDGKNGKFVMKANNYYDLNKFMDMYNTYKKSGASEAEINTKIQDMVLNPDKYVPGIMTFDGTKGRLNDEYFPTTSSAFRVIAAPTGKK
jgi:hypothetical protein